MAKKQNSIKDQVYQTLKENLINCEYAPGAFLNEVELAKQLGCSRTPVREAISRLERDRYLEVVPKKGIFVTPTTLNDVSQIFQARLQIEPLIIRSAIDTIDPDILYMFREKFCEEPKDIENVFRLDIAMHLCIVEHCGNTYIIEMMKKLFEDNTRIIIDSRQNLHKVHESRNEHIAIIDALISKDKEKAASLMYDHIVKSRDAAFTYFSLHQGVIDNQTDSYQELLNRYSI